MDLLEILRPFALELGMVEENGMFFLHDEKSHVVLELDETWMNPPQHQADALAWVCKMMGVKVPPQEPLTWHQQVMMYVNRNALAIDAELYNEVKSSVFDLAETIVLMTSSLGYHQLCGWASGEPKNLPPDFYVTSAYLKKLIDSGYTTEWFPEWNNRKNIVFPLLMSYKDMLQQIRYRSTLMIAQSIVVFVDLLLKGIGNNTKQAKRKCIRPDCDVQVDLSIKKSGACCKEHMNFTCNHPACVKKAQAKGWEKYTHPFGTKIAIEHWEYRISDIGKEKE